jgi:hypothetical protein
VTGDVGGGFGSKIHTYPEYVALAWAARRVGRPAKWVASRSEGFVSDAQSRDHVLVGEPRLSLDSVWNIGHSQGMSGVVSCGRTRRGATLNQERR